MTEIRTRFAPSPTGFLHIGSLRTVLFAYLFAKKNQGKFLLRVEDTDQSREVEGATENLIQILDWFGLKIDEGPTQGGNFGPYIQSQRLSIYQEKLKDLFKKDGCYHCFCSKERLDRVRENQMANKQAPKYDGHCRNLSKEEIQAKLDANTPYVIRQKIPKDRFVDFKDIVKGKMRFDSNTLDDQVLIKSDGFPTYHFAVAVDDNHMQISHVIRSDEWLPSTPKHILLFEAFGYKVPEFVHVPPVLRPDGTKKMSKRDGNVSVEDYIKKGYTKEAIINFLSLLGWNPGTKQELYTQSELEEIFDINRVQKSGAAFDIQKLDWFNWQHKRLKYLEDATDIAMEINPKVEIQEPKKGQKKFNFQSPEELKEFHIKKGNLLENYLPVEVFTKLENDFKSKEFLYKALTSLEELILRDPSKLEEQITIFTEDIESYNKELFPHEKMKVDLELSIKVIEKCIQELKAEDFNTNLTLLAKFKEIIAEMELKNGQVLWPIRVALSNKSESPGVFELSYALGFEQTIKRLELCLNKISS
ncbi:glutamate--tRNA ligase [bacterium]|jgi:glutamyl-tRNA synthetase|nr:glutamate--tRNA ligase [bacterium]MBT6293278.1 glutamate--tRNA ligase [bacterium]